MKTCFKLIVPIGCMVIACNMRKPMDNKAVGSDKIALNDSAFKLFYTPNADINMKVEALRLMDEAIKSDSSYYLAYTNKAGMLCNMGQDSQAISLLGALTSRKIDYAEAWMMKGFLLERAGKKEEAITSYSQAFELYDSKYHIDTQDMFVGVNRAFAMFFRDNLQSYSDLEQVITTYPDSVKDLIQKRFSGINRDKFLQEFCQNGTSE